MRETDFFFVVYREVTGNDRFGRGIIPCTECTFCR